MTELPDLGELTPDRDRLPAGALPGRNGALDQARRPIRPPIAKRVGLRQSPSFPGMAP